MTETKNGNMKLYIGGISLSAIALIIGWLLTGGGYLKDVKNIPALDTRVTIIEKQQAVMDTKLNYIADGMDDLRGKPRRVRSLTGGR